MTDSFACPRSALTDLMSASAIVYVVTRTGSIERVLSDARELRAQEVPYLVVPVLDLTGTPNRTDVEHVRRFDGECFVARRLGADAEEAFATVEIVGNELVTVPCAPTAQPSVVYLDPEPDSHATDHEWAALSALVGWLASAGVPAWMLLRTQPGSDASLADALADRRASAAAYDHDALLGEHREQALLLSDLRLEYDELLQRAIALEKQLQRAAALEMERDALVEAEARARNELEALHATRTLRYTTRLRRIYGFTRSKLRR
jgi:hypothetical protein